MPSPWWRGAVIYQIYPRSYQDSNGDGIGDLAGIIHRLPYVASLGVDAIWLSPFYPSPMHDFGYDVADYRAIDERFGTLEDLRALAKSMRRRNMLLTLDVVVNHTSDKHYWANQARAGEKKYQDYYYLFDDRERV